MKKQFNENVDKAGYPTAQFLHRIARYKINCSSDYAELMTMIEQAWYFPAYYVRKGKIIKCSTAGWSGNENLIQALQQNTVFWIRCWYSSKRGGHYIFKLQ